MTASCILPATGCCSKYQPDTLKFYAMMILFAGLAETELPLMVSEQDLHINDGDRTTAQSVVNLSNNLKMTTVAEGIENEEQKEILA
jgi:hypothetical protein